ncbi:MAG: hypothetical protein U9O24_02295 [Campylobacterota bacterium]|nr:hypothetical protein [Campylobacterota bacterium]
MKLLEDFGVRKIEQYYQIFEKNQKQHYKSIHKLFTTSHLYFLTSIAFFIGFSLTVPIIWLELKFDIFNIDAINYTNITIYAFVLFLLIIIEFYLLFLLGFHTIAYYIYHLKQIDEIQTQHLNESEFLALFARVIMELPEHHVTKHPIRHHQLNNIDIATFSILYKLKVVVSNFLLKLIMKRVLAKSIFRVYTPYIATLGTGVWDAIVFYKTIKHSQYKIMVRYTIDYLLTHKKNLLLEDTNVKALLNRYYYYGEYSNNFEYLLNQILQETTINYTEESYLADHVNKACHQKLLLLIYAFKEKVHTKNEREIMRDIDKERDISKIRKALRSGNTEEIRAFIDIW